MRGFIRFVGWLSVGFGALLCILGLAALPAGGLMFALPFVFLMPGIPLAALGALALFLTRRRRPDAPGPP